MNEQSRLELNLIATPELPHEHPQVGITTGDGVTHVIPAEAADDIGHGLIKIAATALAVTNAEAISKDAAEQLPHSPDDIDWPNP